MRAVVDDAYEQGWAGSASHAASTVEGASRFLQGAVGLTLTLVDEQRWSGADRREDLLAALARLQRDERGEGVDVVVGFLGAEPLYTASIHKLGWAEVLGRHAVVRATDEHMEMLQVQRLLSTLPAGEVGGLLARRRAHKAAVVLAHEVLHLLGGDLARRGKRLKEAEPLCERALTLHDASYVRVVRGLLRWGQRPLPLPLTAP